MQQALYFDWAVSTLFGWGVYGLNLLRHWPRVAGQPAFSLAPIHLESLAGMDPLGLRAIAQPLVDSDQLRLARLAAPERAARLDGIVLHALGNDFRGSTPPLQGGTTGDVTAGVIFFEDTNFSDIGAATEGYDLIVTGSTWCEQVLRARGVERVVTVTQGVDPSHFHRAPRSGALDGRFAVFSGGKLERRKGQDLVLLAFRAFAARHPEAVLVTSWHSPWPAAALTLNANTAVAPVGFTADGRLDAAAWAVANGVAPEQFIDLGAVPNHQMARILREMDVAVFPNRCEGGTNLVAMECMACGVPAIVADNTGQSDLVATGATYALTRQRPLGIEGIGTGTEGWGESDVEEILAALERVYADPEAARRRGAFGAETMAAWSWGRQVTRLHGALTSV